MTLEEAAQHVGRMVLHRPPHNKNDTDRGEIIRVNDTYVFVRYGFGTVASLPEDLELEVPA